MARQHVPLLAFNRGIISKLALARTDIRRTAMSAEEQTNWMPRVLGSMMVRCGTEYISATKNNSKAFHIPFIFATDDTALIQITDQSMRVVVDDEVVTRPSVSTSISNGDFSSATDWDDIDESGATSTIASNVLTLTGTDFNFAGRRQDFTISGGDQGTQHALRVVVDDGPVKVKLGSTSGGSEYFSYTLGTGTHSLTFTPNVGTVYVEITNTSSAPKVVSSCTIESSGAMEITAPWMEEDLQYIRYDQSADIIYIACEGYAPYKVERRSALSWSLVEFQSEDGPFGNINLSTVSLSASATTGSVTLTASAALFSSDHVGALFKLDSVGQQVNATITGENQWSDPIRVIGPSTEERRFFATISGTWSGRVTIQRSVGEVGSWVDYFSYTSNATPSPNDGLNNQIVFYRIGIDTGDYTSGTAEVELSYPSGSISGVVRVTAYTSETEVTATVLKALGGTSGTLNWYEGDWSEVRGYPSAVALNEGRLWWSGKVKIWGSVSDAYESYDNDIEGDSVAINRSIGQGPVDNVNWLLSLTRMLLGTDGAEWSARSSSLDEPLTAENFNLKKPSTQGSAKVAAVAIDDRGLFVQRSGTRVYQLDNTGDVTYGNFKSYDLTELVPEIGEPSIVRMAVQRQPDTRVHCVRGDGKVAILISQPAEEVLCWVLFETDGEVEDVVVLPDTVEDTVYYVVKRTIDGNTVRYLEKWALESECQGGDLNKMADSFVVYDSTATTTITGLDHLEGEEVVIWADGLDAGTDTVSGGQITLSEAASKVVVGLAYEARFKSSKLAYAASMGTALTQKKKADHLALIMRNAHARGIKYGSDFNTDGSGNYLNLDGLPLVEEGAEVDPDTIWEDYDTEAFEFDGTWDTDSRVCLLGQAPRPCTVLAAVVHMNTNG